MLLTPYRAGTCISENTDGLTGISRGESRFIEEEEERTLLKSSKMASGTQRTSSAPTAVRMSGRGEISMTKEEEKRSRTRREKKKRAVNARRREKIVRTLTKKK